MEEEEEDKEEEEVMVVVVVPLGEGGFSKRFLQVV